MTSGAPVAGRRAAGRANLARGLAWITVFGALTGGATGRATSGAPPATGELPAAALEAAGALLPRAQYEETMDHMRRSLVRALEARPGPGGGPDVAAAVERTLARVEVPYDDFLPILARGLAASLGPEDLQRLTELTRSREGQQLASAQWRMLAELSELQARKLREALPALREELGRAHAAPAPGRAQLLQAAGRGDLAGVRQALEAGVPVDAREPSGPTALVIAMSRGHAEVARLLIDRGADVSAATALHFSALMFATARGDAALVRTMLARGADPLVRESMLGMSARDMAQFKHLDEIAGMLREAELGARRPFEQGGAPGAGSGEPDRP
jgi:hypothetical protein